MSYPLRLSRSGLEMIKSFEGYRERATRLADGRWTIGHGHVRSAREGVRINLRDAEDLLIYDIQQIEAAISQRILTPLNQNQHDAIVSFVFNISPGQFADSDVLRLLNAGEHTFAANAMEAWRMARIGSKLEVIDALVRRRAIEKALFLEHPEGRSAAPTPLVTPEFDPAWKRGEVTNETLEDTPAQTSKTEEDAFVDLVSTNIAAIAREDEAADDGDAVSKEEEIRARLSKILEREEAALEVGEEDPIEMPSVRPVEKSRDVQAMHANDLVQRLATQLATDVEEAPVETKTKPVELTLVEIPEPLKEEPEPQIEEPKLEPTIEKPVQKVAVPPPPKPKTQPEPQAEPKSDAQVDIDDTEIVPLPEQKNWSMDERERRENSTRNRTIVWGGLMGLALVFIGYGGFDAYTEGGEQGPLFMMIGAILMLMCGYYLLGDRAKEAEVKAASQDANEKPT